MILSGQERCLSPVAFSGLLHMKHCHAPAASLKPNTSKNLTSSRWSCTWSRSCFRKTKHKVHKLICLLQSVLEGGCGSKMASSMSLLRVRKLCGELSAPVLPTHVMEKSGISALPRKCFLMQRAKSMGSRAGWQGGRC